MQHSLLMELDHPLGITRGLVRILVDNTLV